MEQSLIKYLRESKKAGLAVSAIQQSLLDAGWDGELVRRMVFVDGQVERLSRLLKKMAITLLIATIVLGALAFFGAPLALVQMLFSPECRAGTESANCGLLPWLATAGLIGAPTSLLALIFSLSSRFTLRRFGLVAFVPVASVCTYLLGIVVALLLDDKLASLGLGGAGLVVGVLSFLWFRKNRSYLTPRQWKLIIITVGLFLWLCALPIFYYFDKSPW